jgi:glycosyltransferase involved in cell wall biosynthesis
MRLAFISLMGGLPWGGSEVLWTKTALLALDRGHQVQVVVYDWGAERHPVLTELKSKGAKLTFIPRYSPDQPLFKKLKNYLLNQGTGMQPYVRSILKYHPDHLLISQGGCFDLIQHHLGLYYQIRRKKIKYSLVSHSHPQHSYIPEYKVYNYGPDVFTNALYCFFISKTQQQVVEKAILTKLNNASLTWNPLNLNSFDALKYPEKKEINFAIVGNITSGKGQDIVLEIFSNKHWKARDWKLNIYGSGMGVEYLIKLVEKYSLSSKVLFKGYVSSKNEVWGQSGILLVPSSSEGLPISIIEALLLGRPVIASDVGGIKEIVEDGKNGYLSPSASVESFSITMERAWNERKKWRQMGLVGTELRSRIHFHPEEVLLKKFE